MTHSPAGSPTGFRQVLRDIFDLAELQMQLLSVDSQEARRKATKALILASLCVALSSAMLTVALFGAGYALHENLQWSVGDSLLAVSGAIALIILLLIVVASKLMKTAAAAMQETKSEFAENLRWIRATIISPQSSPRNQIRRESFSDASNNGVR